MRREVTQKCREVTFEAAQLAAQARTLMESAKGAYRALVIDSGLLEEFDSSVSKGGVITSGLASALNRQAVELQDRYHALDRDCVGPSLMSAIRDDLNAVFRLCRDIA